MAQDKDLFPATRDEVISTLSIALRFSRRKRDQQADDLMARIAAGHLADQLARSGFIVSKRLPSGGLAHLDACLLGSTA